MHNHSHSAPQENMGPKYLWGIALNLIFVAVEFGYGLKINSLSLLADAWHNLGDVAGLVISLVAFTMAAKQPTIGSTVSWVAGVGVVINTVTALLFMSNNELNSRSAFLHMAADAGVSLAVLIGGLLITYTGIEMIDPILGVLVCLVILVGTLNIFRQSFRLSLDGVPEGIDITVVEKRILQIPGVKSIEHLHIWALSTTRNAMTAHLMMDNTLTASEQEAIKDRVRHEIEHENVHHCILETSSI